MMPSDQQIFLLSTLLQLEKRARHAEKPAELAFIMVNETLRLIRYRQAILWRTTPDRKKIKIEAVSGADKPDAYAPFIAYLRDLIRHLLRQPENPQIHTIDGTTLPEKLQTRWQEWIGATGVWCPLIPPHGDMESGILLVCPSPLEKGEIALLERLADAYAHADQALKGKKRFFSFQFFGWCKRAMQLLFFLVILFALMLPVRLSVLAPAEIIPLEPFIVSAPMDGVIQRFYVEPNQTIKAQQLLFNLDDTGIRNEYAVSQKALSVVAADLERTIQDAFGNPESRAKIAMLKAQKEQKSAEMAYMADVLERSRIYAEKEGIAVFSDVNDWLGKPVSVGEKVMTIADPKQVEAAIQIPVKDAINLEIGADVKIFLNIKPDRPLSATLRQSSYEATFTPDSMLAFQLRAALKHEKDLPRIGLRGTAKIYGKEVTLFYYLMRRPLTAFRQMTGL